MARDRDTRQDGLEEHVVKIRRCAAVVKGGRRFSFNALVVVGDKRGRVAYGYGKANEVPPAVEKATKDAEERMKRQKRISLRGDTIPHRVIGKFGGSRVILVPAGPGTGVKAGPGVRDVLKACGIRNILTKVHGSTNPINLVKATIQGLLDAADDARGQSSPPARSDVSVMDLSTVHVGVHKLKQQEARRPRHRQRPRQDLSRGAKGQWASAGAKKPTRLFEGGQMQLFRRIPKRGFSHATWDRIFHVVNVGDLDAVFDDGDTVDQETLKKVGLAKGPADGVRILGTGELTKRLVIKAHHFSKSAAEKIAAKGGTAEVIPPPKKPVKNKMKPRPPQAEIKRFTARDARERREDEEHLP